MYLDYQRTELAQAIDLYTKELESIRQRRAMLDSEELLATEKVIRTVNGNNPKLLLDKVRKDGGHVWHSIYKYNYYPD